MAKFTTSTPHDVVFEKMMFYPEMARNFLDIHLPIVLREICDLQMLRPESAGSIEQDLRVYYSDVAWSLKTHGGQGYIYCVIERQNIAAPYMTFRPMRYATATIRYHLDAGSRMLLLVIPMLSYRGQQNPYSWSLNWLGELDNPQLAQQLHSKASPLVDIIIIPDDGIMQHRRVVLLELMQKYIRDRDPMGLVGRLVSLLATNTVNDSQLQTLFNYLIWYGGVSRVSEFIREVTERSPHRKEKLMAVAERLRQEDRQNGLQEGIQQELGQGM